MKLLAAFFLAMLMSPAWAADVHRWEEEDGVTRYSDQMPPPTAKNVQKIKRSPTSTTENAEFSPEAKAAAEKLPVTLFSFEECGVLCKNAEELLYKRGVPFILKNDDAARMELKQLTGKLVAPVLVIGNTAPISGFEETRWNSELDLAGYPAGNPNAKPGTRPAGKKVPLPPEAKAEVEKLPVTLFSFEECGAPCKNAEDLLNRRGVPFTLKSDNAARMELNQLTGKLVAPVLVIGDAAPISGFEEIRWSRELDRAGYAAETPGAKSGTAVPEQGSSPQ